MPPAFGDRHRSRSTIAKERSARVQTAGGLGVFQENRQVEDMPAEEFISPLIKREQQHDEVLSDLFCQSKSWASFKSCAVCSLQFTALLHTVCID